MRSCLHRTVFSVTACWALATVPGCAPPSLLITPVALRRELVETELSRDSWFALDKIALIDVSGTIVNAPRNRLLGEGEHPVSSAERALRALRARL